ncbi:2-hydroxyacyl-CoA dehydratase family protein [Pseudoprimorskyibacter insulae]|uniref:(R)-phenyllactyl-CoA dehydratase beta subunit n=1 Tax=Pseudoprimorskyibacter insulae TaxID=1695997 RepID=A0A2R8APW8_9RHOB|nr:2-hydroxyacyl-CoA dehydratase family protein [Pseudoprimorskyibacter insulae]SPF78126.1 (R)-phenyllactyl-CoA dehydratase beta subunit [Pseudoprimorskyibacter insulae]
MTALADLHARYAARHCCRAGGVGLITPIAPIELVLAAGLRPVRLYGQTDRMPTLADRYMEAEMDGEVRSLFDQFLQGRFAGLDLALLPHASEQHLHLKYYLDEAQRWEPELDMPPVALVDLLQTPAWATSRYDRDRIDNLAQRLGTLGQPITAQGLAQAIAQVNAMRLALRRVVALRSAGRITAADAHRFAALFGAVSASDYADLAGRLADQSIVQTAGLRVVLSGSMRDDTRVYQALDDAGAVLAVDDHVAADRLGGPLVEPETDPFEAVTEYYQLHAPSVRQTPQRPLDEAFVQRCQDAGAQVHICVLEDVDDTLGWDWPRRRDLLQAAGIPSVLLTGRGYFDPDDGALKATIAQAIALAQEAAHV